MRKLIEVVESRKNVYKVHPTDLTQFMIKYGLEKYLLTSLEYNEIPSAITNSFDFDDNDFGLVQEEYKNFSNRLVYVVAEVKVTYTIKVHKHLLNLGTVSIYNLEKIVRAFLNELSFTQESINDIYGIIYNRVISNYQTDKTYLEFDENFIFKF